MLKNSSWRSAAAILALATATIVQACGSSNDTTTATGSIALSLSAPSASVQQGGSTIVTGTVTRTSFTGSVTVTVEGVPTGVSGSVVATGDAAAVTISVASTTVVGVYPLTVRAHGTGLSTDATAIFTLTVTAAPAATFTLLAAPTSLSVAQAATNATGGVKATRTGGFVGAIAYSLSGAPTGVTATFTATATTDSLQLSVSATGAAVVGTYPVLIHGVSGTLDVTTPLSIVVTAGTGGSGSVRLDYSACATASKPLWVAFQDGSGAWTHVTGTGDVYTFNIASTKGGLAVVTPSGATFGTVVTFMSQAEFVANTGGCGTTPVTKVVNGSVAGLNTGDAAKMSLGGSSTTVATNTTFILSTVLNGTFDLVGYRRNTVTPGVGDRGLLRRDQNIAAAGTLAVADFGGAESFAAATANVTAVGGGAGDQIFQSMSYLTGSACTSSPLYTVTGSTATTFAMFGIPSAQQRATDYHSLTLSDVTAGVVASRSVTVNFHAMADRTVTFGALLSPTVTNVTGALTFKRLQAALTLSTDYTIGLFSYSDTPGNTITVIQSAGFLGGNTAVTLVFPDLSAAAGLVTTWFPASAAAVTYAVAGITAPTNACIEGAISRFTSTTGTM
jgi:hypothetical protein